MNLLSNATEDQKLGLVIDFLIMLKYIVVLLLLLLKKVTEIMQS